MEIRWGRLREEAIRPLATFEILKPLLAVYACSNLLERPLTDPSLSVIASRIKTNVRRMSGLIDDALDFFRARLGSGIGLDLADAENIATGLSAIVQGLQNSQPDARILSNINAKRIVQCDLGRLQQVAAKLLGNANGLTKSQVTSSDLVLKVRNAGEPISPESLGEIFEPIWRYSVSANPHGLGFGLHIVRRSCLRTKGSTHEQGTQFTARIPLNGHRRQYSAVERSRLQRAASDASPFRCLPGNFERQSERLAIGALPYRHERTIAQRWGFQTTLSRTHV